MAGTFAIELNKPLASVKIIEDCQSYPDAGGSGVQNAQNSEHSAATQAGQLTSSSDIEKRKAEIAQLQKLLNNLLDNLNRLHNQMLADHKEEIISLSVEIANKVLMHKVQKGDYQIESIIKEALKSAPVHNDVTIHLNPEDVVQCQKLQQEEPDSAFAGLKLVADPNIGQAECLLETPKGIIRSSIEEHLERISEALKKVE